jgi:hypothetical protein
VFADGTAEGVAGEDVGGGVDVDVAVADPPPLPQADESSVAHAAAATTIPALFEGTSNVPFGPASSGATSRRPTESRAAAKK